MGLEVQLGYRDPRTGRPSEPNPKQRLAHLSEAEELLYGGAAFGGKSEYLLQEAIATCLTYPGCEVALFRRTLKELEQSLVVRFLTQVPRHIARYREKDSTARFFNGSILRFLYCDSEKDVFRYQSAEWILLGIDQVEQWSLSMALYLFTRVRSSRGWPCRIRLTANPGNIGGPWLKARYIAPAPEVLGDRALPHWDGEVWRPVDKTSVDDTPPLSRAFIQSRMTDNVIGMQADPGYVARIRANPDESQRRMLEEGDWDVFPGQMFESWRAQRLVTMRDLRLIEAGVPAGAMIPWHVIPDKEWEPPRGATIFGSVDYGYGNPWSVHWHAAMSDQHIVTFKEFYSTKVRDVEQAQRMHDWLAERWAEQKELRRPLWHVEYVIGDIPFGSRREHGLSKSIFEVYEEVFAIPLKINLMQAPKGAGSRKARVQRTHAGLAAHADGFPNWQITAACPNLIRTLPALVVDPADPDDILHGVGAKKQEDHCWDECSTFLASRPPFPSALDEDQEDRSDVGVAFGVTPPSRGRPVRRLNVAAFGRYR